jgi:hypothetical protein
MGYRADEQRFVMDFPFWSIHRACPQWQWQEVKRDGVPHFY